MFGWVVTFLLIGLIAALLGFGGIAGTSFAITKVIFFHRPDLAAAVDHRRRGAPAAVTRARLT